MPPSRSGPARPGHRFLSQRKRWERKGRGCAPGTHPKNGGSWRRWVVRAGQRPGVHCRPLYWRLRHGRCRASGGTHRDYPASPDGRCAVPTWPAGPPSVPCLRNTGAAAVAGKRRVKDAAPYIVGPSYGSFASGQARKLIPSAGPPLPTATTPLGRRGGPNFYARPEPRGRYSVSPPGRAGPSLFQPVEDHLGHLDTGGAGLGQAPGDAGAVAGGEGLLRNASAARTPQ